MRTNSFAGFSIFIFLSLPSLNSAQTTANSSPPPTASPKAADDAYAKEPYVFEFIENRLRFEADGKGQRDLSFRVRLQSESALREFGLLTYSFASTFESLDVLTMRVHKPDGSIVDTPTTDVQEVDSAVSREAPMYTDEREKHIAVKSLGVGDTLEGQIRWTIHGPLALGHFWFDHSFFNAGICLKEGLIFDVPASLSLKLHNSDPQPSVKESAGRRIYTFARSNLTHPADKDKIPDWEKNYHGAPLPDVSLSSFSSWAEVGAWFGGLQQTKVTLTPEIQAKADELTKGKSSDDEKMRAIYDFVSARFRYIGIDLGLGRYTPHSASEVLVNRFGDCKDKHTLFAALLKAAGIQAYPALISSKFKVDPSFPTASIFDHVITAIPQGDSFLFLDTTPEVAPYGLLLANLRDRQALVIPSSGPARLVATPVDPPIPNYEHARIDASIDTSGTLDAKMRFEDRGDGELALRLAYRATPQNRWQELTQNITRAIGFAGTVSDVSIAQPEDTSQPFWMSFSYHRTDYPDWKNNRVTLPAPGFGLPPLNEEQKLSKDPLPLGPLQDVIYDTTLKLPKGYMPLLPEKVEHNSDFAQYSATYSVDSDTLHGTLRFKTLVHEIPGSARPRFSDLSTTIEESSRRYILLVGNGLVGPNGTPSGLLALLPSKVEDAIPILEKKLTDNPDDKSILIQLSEAYCKTGRAKDAVSLVEKALEKNPEHPEGLHLSLGRAYLALPDSDKAIPHFEKGFGPDPAPTVLNEVAYALADANVKLSQALSYSMRAVKMISSETMDIAPVEAKHADFALMANLAVDWDTLGWIKFRMGDTAAAEKYLQASWQLDQTAVNGEHLVEAYEKLGKKHKAALICNMAQALLNSSGAVSDSKLRDNLAGELKRLKPFLKASSSAEEASDGTHSPDGQVALVDIRSIDVPFSTKLKGEAANAQFVLGLTNGGKASDAVFVSGSEELRDASTALATTKYPLSFPDEIPARVLRKGSLSCSAYSKQCLLMISTVSEAMGPAANAVALGFNPGSYSGTNANPLVLAPPVSPAKPLYDAARRAGNSRDYATSAQLYEQAVAKDPSYMDAWNSLGWTYNNLRRYEKAEAALRKALALNPAARYAHNNLGDALMGQKKYEQAVPEFQREIELSPKDPWAHENLGRALVLLSQFDKAIPVLEDAATLLPDQPAVQFNLGHAYAKTSQPDKAVQAFTRSVELEPTAARWNWVAYEMALDNVDLDQAQKYSESSIAYAVEHLNQLSLDALSNDDVQLPANLAAYWDTLGWIKFQQGKVQDAEKYVICAWQIRSIPEIGDHLGQIYAKEGRTAEAIQMYALALAAGEPLPETKQRLVTLSGSDAPIERILAEARTKFAQASIVTLKNPHDLEGTGEFWLVFSPSLGSAAGASSQTKGPSDTKPVDGQIFTVKFISGDEPLRDAGPDILPSALRSSFPDTTEIKLLRRGKLTCSHSAGSCTLIPISTEKVRSVN